MTTLDELVARLTRDRPRRFDRAMGRTKLGIYWPTSDHGVPNLSPLCVGDKRVRGGEATQRIFPNPQISLR